MAIRPVMIHDDGTVTVWHDERGHGGTLALADLAFGRTPAGRTLTECIVTPCPACGKTPVARDGTGGEWVSYSVHPVSGGCDAERVQRLFAHVYERHPDVPAKDAEEAHALARERSEALDPGRWRLASPEEERRQAERRRQAALAAV